MALSDEEMKMYRQYYGDENLSESEILEKLKKEKKEFDEGVDKIASGYVALDMDMFVNRIGGWKKVDEMRRINEVTDRMQVFNGNITQKKITNDKEDLNEWKKGFMEGFEEAYKRLNNLQ